MKASKVVGTVLVVGAVAVITALSISLHADAARSSETQHHGLPREGVVDAVHTVHHDTSHDSWTSYDYDVTLAEPVGGGSTTVVHDPTEDLERYAPGDQVSVLVDPDDSGYAELPGKPVQASTWWLAPVIIGSVLVGLVLLVLLRGRAVRRGSSPEPAVRSLFAAGRLAEAARMVDRLDPFAPTDHDPDLSLAAAVLDAYGDQLAATDRAGADAAWSRAAELQRAFASTATAGGEGIARMDAAARIEAKCGRPDG